MFGRKTLRSRFTLSLILGGMITFALGAFSGKAYFVRKQIAASPKVSPFLIEGFDFNLLRSSENEWRGPNVGEKIDLTRLQRKDGKTLASVIPKRPIVLVSINPACAMCKNARDEMSYLREKLSSMDITYYLVGFASETPQLDFFRYSDSLRVGAQSFLWDSEGGRPPESIIMMTNPSHLLLNSDGRVIRVWPGSYNDKAVRDRMANQIIADVSMATDSLKATLPR
jgi:hypothetical protein